MIKLVIPGEFADLNTMIEACKTHWNSYRELKKADTAVARLSVRNAPKIPGRNKYILTWYCSNRKKDPPNIEAGGSKSVFDGLVEAGIIPNDGWKQIASIEHRFEVDKHRPRVEIMAEEVGA